MTFTEEWFGVESQGAVARLANGTRSVRGVCVEVGCWEGRSTAAIANAVWPEALYAVDTWQGSPGEISADIASQRDVFATFTENMGALTGGNVTPCRMGWREWFGQNTEPIRFLHIDAEHSYAEVRDNIAAALPVMSSWSIICGDDAHHEPVMRAVADTLGVTEMFATLWWKRIGAR